jgi:hypothetical protein
MDPYLEATALWPAFHHAIISSLDETVRSGLAPKYRLQIVLRRYSLGHAPAQPAEQRVHEEEYIEIHKQDDGRLVTLLDVVSTLNKTTQSGRDAYLETRRSAVATGANLVEVDLVLQGRSTLDYSREGLPDWDYAATVTRAKQPDRFEIYTATLEKRLPRFRLPLAADDRDTVVDLQAMFTRCYAQGEFAAKIDYDRDPPAEVICSYAYRIWKAEGCPDGRDKDHWYKALADLKPWVQQRPSNG